MSDTERLQGAKIDYLEDQARILQQVVKNREKTIHRILQEAANEKGLSLVTCPGYGCADRRTHYEDNIPRGPQHHMVPKGQKFFYCSMTCMLPHQSKLCPKCRTQEVMMVRWKEGDECEGCKLV